MTGVWSPTQRVIRPDSVLEGTPPRQGGECNSQCKKGLCKSLHFKRVHSSKPIFSVRITKDYLSIGILEKNEIIWFWIGNHEEYEKIDKRSHRHLVLALKLMSKIEIWF